MSLSESSYCFLINCLSNSSRAESFFKERENYLENLFPDSEFIYIQPQDSIKDIAKAKAESFTHIIACGGDGTVNRVANGIIGTDAVMGVLPFGSGNDFAQNIGLNRDFDSSVKVLQQNSITEIDAVENESGVFINTFGIGIDGLTNFYASNSKFKTGSLRYFFGGLKALMVSKPFEASIYIPELKVFIRRKIWMVVVANGKTEGGRYTISPSSNNYDGELEIVVVKSVPRLRILIEFLKLSFGFPFKKSIIESYKVTEECKIETAYKVRAHSDGEQIFGNKTYSFKLLTSSLPVVTDMKSR